jgi:hypothetical protein
MITSRFITEEDYDILKKSLEKDEYHFDTPPEFFYEEGTVCSVYNDEDGPILFVRGQPIEYGTYGVRAIRLDIQYLNNRDAKRNLKAMLEGFPELETKAKANGFSEFFFMSDQPFLRKFCVKRLGFKEVNEDILVKILLDKSEQSEVL